MEMQLEIITPDKTVYSGEVNAVKLPGSQGSFEVLKNHAPLIASLEGGQVRITRDNGDHEFFTVGPGFAEVLNNKVIVLV